MVWKGARAKLHLPVLVLELGLTAQSTVGGRAQHSASHLLTVAHWQLQQRSCLRLLRSMAGDGPANFQLMPRPRTRLPSRRQHDAADSRRTSGVWRVN